MPKVSVNIPAYNDEKYIAETVQSVINQTYQDWELIIIDDGSKDKTGEIVKSFTDPRIKYFYQENRGIGAARNSAIEKSSGEYIAFLDHDDLWLPSKLEKQIALFENNPDLGLVYCDTIFFNDKGDIYRLYERYKPFRGRVFRELLKHYFLSCETVIIRKSVLGDVGGFMPQMMMAEEYDLFMRIAYKYPIDYVPEPLAKYRIHEKNYSRGKHRQGLVEERETIERLMSLYPDMQEKYKSELDDKMKDLKTQEVILLWKEGKKEDAKKFLAKIGFFNKKIFLLMLAINFFSFDLYKKYSKNPFLR